MLVPPCKTYEEDSNSNQGIWLKREMRCSTVVQGQRQCLQSEREESTAGVCPQGEGANRYWVSYLLGVRGHSLLPHSILPTTPRSGPSHSWLTIWRKQGPERTKAITNPQNKVRTQVCQLGLHVLNPPALLYRWGQPLRFFPMSLDHWLHPVTQWEVNRKSGEAVKLLIMKGLEL